MLRTRNEIYENHARARGGIRYFTSSKALELLSRITRAPNRSAV
jgi:hypothetical protein